MTSEFGLAVHALIFLNRKGGTVSSELLADNICTNPARIRRVLSKLKKAGLVETKEGIDGGYRFTLDPRAVSLRALSDALGVLFVSASWHSGNIDRECLVSSGMGAVMDGIYAGMDALCRAHLETITIADIDRQIFGAQPPNTES